MNTAINDLNPRLWDFSQSPSWMAIVASLIFTSGILYLLNIGFRIFSNSKINKFSITGEIEFGEASIFNHYLDEILYFFERTDYDVVIFEDIDRHDTIGVFTKLREINNLINNSDIIEREISFIYAIKDTLFEDKTERVKFFDFIIPVIPFVNSKNASEQLNKLIQDHELTDKLSKRFVSELVSYIHDIDMRLLINTFHEYTVFRENLGEESINHEELFSIIVYKNLYPEDFSKLYREEGKLFNVISKREEYEKALTGELTEKIKHLEDDIKEIEKHNHIQVKELRAIYVLKLLEKLPNNTNLIHLNDEPINPYKLIDDDNFHELQLSKNIEYSKVNYSGIKRSDISFTKIEKLIESELLYNERVEFIRGKNRDKVNSIKNEILTIKEKISDVKKLSLSDIFVQMNSDEIFGDLKENDLVRFLLMGGYLNENYSDYISLFHEVDLTRDEFKYRNAIKSNKDPKFEFKVTHRYSFINDLSARYFSKKSILNYDIVEHLIKHSIQFSDKLSMLYSSFDNRETIYFEFIIGFVQEKPDCREKFIPNFIKYRKSFCDELLHSSNLPDEKTLQLVTFLFEYSNSDDLQQLENVESLKSYLEEIENPISIVSSLDNRKTYKQFITDQSLKFKKLEKPDSSSLSFFNFVIENKAYVINYSNTLLILKSKLNEIEDSSISESLYTLIRETDLSSFKNYIEQNINAFVSKVLLYKNMSQSESEDSVIALLNTKNLKTELKGELISIQKHKISSLDKLDNYEDKKIATSANKIKPTWNNVFHFYDQLDENSLNETIINFLNNEENYTELSKGSVSKLSEIEEGKRLNFRDSVLYCAKLNRTAYESLLKSLTPIDFIEFSWLNVDMAKILLEKDAIDVIPHNFDGLKSFEGSLHISLIEKNFQKFIKNIGNYSLDVNDWFKLLNSEKINTSQKSKLHSYLTVDELSDSNIAKKVLNLHPDQKIEGYGIDKIKALLSHQGKLKDRISILLKYIDDLNDDELNDIVSEFGKPYKKLFKLKKRPSFPNNKEHELLLKNLNQRGIIKRIITNGEKIKAICQWKK